MNLYSSYIVVVVCIPDIYGICSAYEKSVHYVSFYILLMIVLFTIDHNS